MTNHPNRARMTPPETHTLRDRVARALDLTHAFDGRGLRTYGARQRLAAWLDGSGCLNLSDVRWLERVEADHA